MRDTPHAHARRRQVRLVSVLLLIALAPAAMASESPGPASSAEIAQSAISSLPKSNGRNASVVANLDLTAPFRTSTQWTFLAANLSGTHFSAVDAGPIDGGALAQCFVEKLTPHCQYSIPQSDDGWFSTPLELYSATVVFAGADNTRPLLLIQSGSASGVDGSHSIYTELFAYDRRSDKFRSIFSNDTGSNNNQKTRFVQDGPLRGDVIVDQPSGSYYWVEVYRPGASGRYVSVLGYRSHTVYGDRNRLSVSDSEMPEILRRLGLWHKGDALPIPHEGCVPVMRRGEEWCQ